MSFNRNAFAKGNNYRGPKSGTSGGGRFLSYFDWKKLETDAGITKLKIEADGEYYLDFLPWKISKSHPYYRELSAQFSPEEPMDWMLDVSVHEVVTPNGKQRFLCPKKTFNKNCPFCDEYWRIYNSNRDEGMGTKEAYHKSKDVLVPLKTKERNLSFVYNRTDNKVYLFDYSDFYFGEKLRKKLERTNGTDAQVILPDPSELGHTLHFFIAEGNMTDKQGNALPGAAEDMEFIPRTEALPESLYNNLPALEEYLILHDEDTINSFLDGTYFVEVDEPEPDDVVAQQTAQPRPTIGREPSENLRNAMGGRSRPTQDDPLTPNLATGGNTNATSVEDDPRDARRRAREERKSPICPAGGKFGEDIDTLDACDGCGSYSACDAQFEATH